MEPFSFEEESYLKLSSLELDEDLSAFGWNVEEMLLTNQTKYGYKSTYNSDLSEYTLPVQKEDSEEFRRREEEAEKIAQEIESSASYRRNIDKELSDNEEEEEAFSAVIRANCGETRRSLDKNNNNQHIYCNGFKQSKRGSYGKQQSQRTTPNSAHTNGNSLSQKNVKTKASKRFNNYLQTI